MEKIWAGMFVCVLFKPTCAVAFMDRIIIKTIVIHDGFCSILSHYNKILYKQLSKIVILNAFYKQYHDSSRIGLNHTGSVLEDIYVVYFAKTRAWLTKQNIYEDMKRFVWIRKIPSTPQWDVNDNGARINKQKNKETKCKKWW